jgi:prepilin-type N-terminal cleavage/methylation domain-containing protein/prepilin-type processing-associated H-X9-DG protein
VRPHLSKRRAFTLIELLIVIGVIGVLASLLLPALTSAKRSAQFTRCKSNLHQVGMALTMYVSDFNVYPPTQAEDAVSYASLPALAPKTWADLLEPYTSGKQLRVLFTLGSSNDPVFSCPCTYGYNETGVDPAPCGVLGLGGTTVGLEHVRIIPVPENRVLVPSEMIAVGDLGMRDEYGNMIPIAGRIGFFVSGGEGPDQRPIEYTKRRHGSKANMVFCDAHVEGLRFTRLYMSKDEQLQRWNADNMPHRDLVPPTGLQP